MALGVVDYVIVAAAVLAGCFGLVNGFSGALAFLSGAMAAVLAGRLAKGYFLSCFEARWLGFLALFVVALLAFGLVRAGVRRIVHGLLAQPADALLGAAVAALTGGGGALAVVFFVRHFGLATVESSLLTAAGRLLGRFSGVLP